MKENAQGDMTQICRQILVRLWDHIILPQAADPSPGEADEPQPSAEGR